MQEIKGNTRAYIRFSVEDTLELQQKLLLSVNVIRVWVFPAPVE